MIYNAAFTQNYDTSQYDNPYLFTGRHMDSLDSDELKLQYNRNRYYDYYTGRWLSHDPLGVSKNISMFEQKNNELEYSHNFKPVIQYNDGMCLYGYVSNRPVLMIDSYGMWGDDLHGNWTYMLAYAAGMKFRGEIAMWAMAPDKDTNRTPVDNSLEALKPWTSDKKARDLLNTVAYWHFPGADMGVPVRPGSPAARREIRKGIALCNLKIFSEGLHPFQDSWSHQSPPGRLPPIKEKVGHSRDRKGWYTEHTRVKVLTIMGYVYIDNSFRRMLEVVTSKDADQLDIFTDAAREATKKTYGAMLSFIGKCPCIRSGPHAGEETCSRESADETDVFKAIYDKIKESK